MLKRAVKRQVARDFYPFVEKDAEAEGTDAAPQLDQVRYPARIAVYDDAAAAPRVVIVDPADVRTYLEEVTATVNRLSHEQGGSIPFMVIREIVENLIHAYFISPTVTILDHGNTIRFSDQGPGIKEKSLALEYGTTSATEEMKRYIRGVGSGLPYAQQYMVDKGGSLEIEDNLGGGTVVTISTHPMSQAREMSRPTPCAAEQPVEPMPRATVVAAPSAPTPTFELSERGQLAVDYLLEHDLAGPTDLVRACGYSAPTWSRELSRLVSAGLVRKVGQKYQLTPVGRSLA